MSEEIQAAVDEFGTDDVIEAIGVAVKADVRKWAYVNGVLKRWRKDGKDKPSTNDQAPSKKQEIELIKTLARKYGRARSKQAREELSGSGLWETIKRMGGWYDVCNMKPEQIKFAYYEAVKT